MLSLDKPTQGSASTPPQPRPSGPLHPRHRSGLECPFFGGSAVVLETTWGPVGRDDVGLVRNIQVAEGFAAACMVGQSLAEPIKIPILALATVSYWSGMGGIVPKLSLLVRVAKFTEQGHDRINARPALRPCRLGWCPPPHFGLSFCRMRGRSEATGSNPRATVAFRPPGRFSTHTRIFWSWGRQGWPSASRGHPQSAIFF